jgi:hypothetical protein
MWCGQREPGDSIVIVQYFLMLVLDVGGGTIQGGTENRRQSILTCVEGVCGAAGRRH